MSESNNPAWISAVRISIESYRGMIDAIVEQLTDEELMRQPFAEVNSVATILRHLGGNLRSRWTDFLATDGEKPDRDRESEFSKWDGTRHELIEYFDKGWQSLASAVDVIIGESAGRRIEIRGEPHTLADALLRAVNHIAYHVGQMAIVARVVHEGEWKWLTIAPGKSSEFNSQTWGSAASRSIFAVRDDNQ